MNPDRVVSICDPALRYAASDSAKEGPAPTPMSAAVEALLGDLGLDPARRGTPAWNPFGDLVTPGASIVIKPNLVSSKNLHERIEGRKLQASSTHGALLRPILELAVRAVGPRGRVTVIDAPIEGCDVERVMGPLGVRAVIDDAATRGGADVSFVDLRTFRVVPRMLLDDARFAGRSWNAGALVREPLPGDPRGYAVVDLGARSAFARADAPPGERLRFHRSHYATPVPHHTGGRHEYSIPRTLLDADLLINLSKLKTHKKTGVTLSLKGVIGLTNEKYWLPHFTEGDPSVGGDELDRPQTLAERIEQKLSRLPLPRGHSLIARAPRVGRAALVIDGSWEGNRTLWRTILDLAKIALHADRDGRVGDAPARRYLSIVDGVVGGEGEGPLGATPVDAGVLVAGFDPARVDAVATHAMGIDPSRIVHVVEGLRVGLVAPPAEVVDVVRDLPAASRVFVTPRAWPSLRA